MQTTSLAIMAKIELLYEQVVADPSTFLSFIPVALPFENEELRLMASTQASGDDARRALSAAADFAVLANYVPAVSSLWSQDGRLLWDAYAQVLGRGQVQVAQPRLTDGEIERLKAAEDLLHDRETGTPTSTYERYRALQEAYLQARERLAAASLTAEHSDDPEFAAQARTEETRLAAEAEAALDAWRMHGARSEVEAALATVERLTGLSLEVEFQAAADRLQRARRTGLNPGVDTFYDTGYLPRGLFGADAVWTKLELDASEIDALARAANDRDPELQAFSDDDEEIEIRRLSVELGRAEVVRPWFDLNLLTSRSWRWRGDLPPLSDGGEPPEGSLPAYVTAMIFVRNLEIELVPGSARNARQIEDLQAGDLKILGNIVLQQVPSTLNTSAVARLTSARSDHHSHALAAFAARRAAVARPIDEPRRRPTPTGVGSRPAAVASMVRTFARTDALSPPSRATPSVRGTPAPSVAARVARDSGHLTGVDRPRPRIRDHRTGAVPGSGRILDFLRKQRPTVRVPAQRADQGGLEGRVTAVAARGRAATAIEGARVSAIDDAGEVVRTVVTDDSGDYVLRLPAGRYGLEVMCEGYVGYVAPDPVVIRSRRRVKQDVVLQAEPVAPVTEHRPGIQLVAVLCRTVPKAPDPDPQLSWD